MTGSGVIPTMGAFRWSRLGVPGEVRVAEGEDVAGRAHLPVAEAVGRGRHADDVLVGDRGGRPVEAGVAVGEDPAVGRDEPVALAVGRRRHADHGRVEVEGPGGAVEARVAVGEHAAVGGDEPVPALPGYGRHADHGFVQGQAAGAPAEVLPEREDAPVGPDGEVAVSGPRRDGRTVRAGRRRRRTRSAPRHGGTGARRRPRPPARRWSRPPRSAARCPGRRRRPGRSSRPA